MDFSPATLASLSTASQLDESSFNTIVTHVFNECTGKSSDTVLLPTNLPSKSFHTALLTLVLEGCKHDMTKGEMSTFLEDHNWSSSRTTSFLSHYDSNRSHIRSHYLSQLTSFQLDKIINISWRLDDYIRGNTLDHIRQPTYYITFHTLQSNGNKKDILFTANYQEMQDLLSKLKDAQKQIERLQE